MNVTAILTLAAVTLTAAELSGHGNQVIAHEWGTFTSVADDNGSPVSWAPLYGVPDLPCFVSRLDSGHLAKWQISGLVRMETPVLYFYSGRPVTLAVHVGFPQGLITEWYPPASKVTPNASTDAVGPVYQNGSIEWNAVNVVPGAKLTFPSTAGASRYYAARETDADPLRIGDQQEKLIFYRGVGSFAPRLRPRYTSDGKLEIRNAGVEPIPLAILFENHGGKIGYRTVRAIDEAVTVDPPALTGDFNQLRRDLTAYLLEFGLYSKEASAMIETWRDSWFEEGTRVLYIVPKHTVSEVLPLSVTPPPDEATRVFVGRVEVLSPSTRQTLQDAAERGDLVTLEKFGRFLGPFSRRMVLHGAAVQNAIAALDRTSQGSCIR